MLKICQIILICCIPILAGKELTAQELNDYTTNYMEWENFERQRSFSYVFDGCMDLLIHETSSGVTGGHWQNYRGIILKE